jgi:hypothetical protein
MSLAERLSELVRAAFAGIWVQSFEHDDAIMEIARLCRQNGWALASWDIDRGLSLAGRDDSSSTAVSANDPLAAIKVLGPLAADDGTALLVHRNFHRFLGSAEVVQALDTAIAAGKQARTLVVILAPVVQIPSSWSGSSSSSSTSCPAATNSCGSPARSPASRASCRRAMAWTPCSTRRRA